MDAGWTLERRHAARSAYAPSILDGRRALPERTFAATIAATRDVTRVLEGRAEVG
jgi:hypothetical protein